MNADLENEVEALNSIYGPCSLALSVSTATEDPVYKLRLPHHKATLRLSFPTTYPDVPPEVLGIESSDLAAVGDARDVLHRFRDAMGRVWQPGLVCIFDAIEELGLPAAEDLLSSVEQSENDDQSRPHTDCTSKAEVGDVPNWVLSEPVTELKSIFIARSITVTSPAQANAYIQHLLATDKKVAKATHNITAYRINGNDNHGNSNINSNISYQDCDDDGETAAGGRLLHLLQLMKVWNVLIVVTRWYGGQKLGPARFGIINDVARDAVLRGGYGDVRAQIGGHEKGRGKGRK